MAEPKPFRPSVRQRRLAEAACSLAFSVQPRLVCAEAQIPHSTYYRWQKNPAFTAWLAATVLQCLAANSPFLLLNTLQAALTGDASARKLIFQFCIAPRLAPAMAALPAPGLEAFLGLPATTSSDNDSRVAVPAAKTQTVPSNSDSRVAVSAAKTNAPPAAEPTAPPINNQPPSSADPAAPCPSPVPNPSSQPRASEAPPSPPQPTPPSGRSSSPRPRPRIAPMWRVNKEGKLEPLPRAYW